MITRERLLSAFIRAYLNVVLIVVPTYCLTWLILRHPPVFWQVFLISEVLEFAARAFFRHRRRREVLDLQAIYDQPAYGEQ